MKSSEKSNKKKGKVTASSSKEKQSKVGAVAVSKGDDKVALKMRRKPQASEEKNEKITASASRESQSKVGIVAVKKDDDKVALKIRHNLQNAENVSQKGETQKVGVSTVNDIDKSNEDKVAVKVRKGVETVNGYGDSNEDKVAKKVKQGVHGISTNSDVAQASSDIAHLIDNNLASNKPGAFAASSADKAAIKAKQGQQPFSRDIGIMQASPHIAHLIDNSLTSGAFTESSNLHDTAIIKKTTEQQSISTSTKPGTLSSKKQKSRPLSMTDVENISQTTDLSEDKVAEKLFSGSNDSRIMQVNPMSAHMIDNSLASSKPGAINALTDSAGDKIKNKNQQRRPKDTHRREEMKRSLSNDRHSTEEISNRNPSQENHSKAISDRNLPQAVMIDDVELVSIDQTSSSDPIVAVDAKLVLPWYKQKKIVGLVLLVVVIIVGLVVILLLTLNSEDSNSNTVSTPAPSLSPSLSLNPTSIPSFSPTGFIELQRFSLRNFYKNQNGKYWQNSSGWSDMNDNSDVCDWFGITCGGQFRDVVEINLSNNNLTGELHIDDMMVLQTLEEIDLTLNNITGNMTYISDRLASIPSLDIIDFRLTEFYGDISQTYCDVHGSKGKSIKDFDGVFVDCNIGCSCCKAREVYCGCIDVADFVDMYGDTCQWYDNNEVEGCPTWGETVGFGSFSNITANEACCRCNGGISQSLLVPSVVPSQTPSSTYVGTTQRDALISFYNDANGDDWTINRFWLKEETVCNWYGLSCISDSDRQVSVVDLPLNNLTGTLSSEIGLLKLTRLSVFENMLTGSIPSEIGLSSKLTFLGLDYNLFQGKIPSELGLLSNLTSLHLYENHLTGTIPSEIGLSSKLTYLYLEYNLFQGKIPSEIGLLSNLNELYLNDNNFTGTLPIEICELCAANDLDVYISNTNIEVTADCGC